MKYIVTGAAGFIGSHLVDKLIDNGQSVICIDDLSTGSINNLPEDKLLIFINKKIQYVKNGDLPQRIDGIFHLAAQASVSVSIDNYFGSSSNNMLAALKVWDIAIKRNIPVVYASSSAVYGNLPLGDDKIKKYDIISPYAQDKLTMEDYANMCWKVYNTVSIGLRFFNVYGPRQDPASHYSGVISIFIDRLEKNQPIIVNGGYQTRDFIYAKDIVDTMVCSMDYLFKHKCCYALNVGTGRSITIDHLLKMIVDIMKVQPDVILKELPPGDPEQSGGKYEKLKSILNIDPSQFVKLEEGLLSTIKYIRNY